VAPLAAAARGAGVTIGILVDIDLGMNRCGVASPGAALSLARQVAAADGLRFDGLMGYEGHTLMIDDPDAKRAAIREAIGRLLHAKTVVEAAGLPCRIISAGGTGSYQYTAEIPGITEIQAGGGIFACNYYTRVCHVAGHVPALHVLATVVSRPADDRAILDIGRKSVSDYRTPPTPRDHPDWAIVGLSAEHATVTVPAGPDPKIGERLSVIPGYSDFTFVLHDRVLGHRAGSVETAWDLLGRGKLQ
jgi:D-serine deaminase-like pyridoxal phosphate-dependent protein